jgi:hypothetical protein
MRIIMRSVVIATISLCATGAFAANNAVVDIPFSFVSHGHVFPAGHYVATLDATKNVLGLSNIANANVSAHWIASPAECNAGEQELILKFDGLGDSQTLRTVQLGSRITPRLDAPRHHNASSIAAEVGGQ